MHGLRYHDNIHVCKLIDLYTANAYSTEREMSASAGCIVLISLYFRQYNPERKENWKNGEMKMKK